MIESTRAEFTNSTKLSHAPARTTANPGTRSTERKVQVLSVALSVALFGLTTASQAETSLEQQLDLLRNQVEQQQRMIEAMQRQLDAQMTADAQRAREEEEIKQQAAEAETVAVEAERGVEEIARIEGIDLSEETDRMGDTKGTQFEVPNTDTVMTISGFIKASAIHDFDKIGSPTKFVTADIVVNGQPANQPGKRTTFTANASRIIFGTATPLETSTLSTLFSWDFNGNTTSASSSLRLRQAWGQLDDIAFGGDLRFGQAWSTWSDVDALPETMDFQGPNGSQQKRQPLVRWSRDFDKRYTLQLALEQPGYNITDGSDKTGWPDTIASLNWQGDWGHLRPAVIGRQIRGNDSDHGTDTVFGWGMQVAGTLNVPQLAEKDSFKFQAVYGAGIGSYNNDGGYDDALFTDDGDLKAIKSFQGYGAFEHWWTAELRSNAVVGWVNVDNRSEQSADSLDRTLYTAANLVWSPYEQVDMGIEWLWGKRKNKNSDDGDANRIMASTKFKF